MKEICCKNIALEVTLSQSSNQDLALRSTVWKQRFRTLSIRNLRNPWMVLIKAVTIHWQKGVTALWITTVETDVLQQFFFISCVQRIKGQWLWPSYYICDWIVLAGTLMRWLMTWAEHYFRHGRRGGWHKAATSSELISPETEWRQLAEPREMCLILSPHFLPSLLCLPFPLLFLASNPKAPTSSIKVRSVVATFRTTVQSTLKSWSGLSLSQAL